MKKALVICGVAVVIIAIAAIVIAIMAPKDPITNNDDAQKDKEGRYLTIINSTEQIINEVHITVGDGAEIKAMDVKDPDETSFSLEIPEEYDEYTDFIVTLVDRHDLKYQKEVNEVPPKGRTEVKFTEEDYVEEKGDWWDKVNKWFNGD